MKTYRFPVSYFISCFSPKKMFLNRNNLNIGQIIVVIIFLIFLMLNPVAINANKFPEFNLKTIMPDLIEGISMCDIDELSSVSINDGELAEKGEIDINSLIFVNATNKQFNDVKTGLNFETSQLVLKDKNGLEFTLKYPETIKLSSISSNQEFEEWLSNEWNSQNSSYRIISLVCLAGIFICCSTLFLVFGTAFFLWLTKKNHLSSIRTYKESVNVTLNALFLSTLIATIMGLVFYDITLMMTIQAFGLVLEILLIFAKTKFNDDLARK